MSTHGEITAEVTSWEEATYRELDGGGKLTRATVGQTLAGDLVGEGVTEFLMCYQPDGTASFIGQQHVVGRIGNRSGAFVVERPTTFIPAARPAFSPLKESSNTTQRVAGMPSVPAADR